VGLDRFSQKKAFAESVCERIIVGQKENQMWINYFPEKLQKLRKSNDFRRFLELLM